MPPEVGFVSAVTIIVLPAQGFEGVVSGLLQEVKLMVITKTADMHKTIKIQDFITVIFCRNVIIRTLVALP